MIHFANGPYLQIDYQNLKNGKLGPSKVFKF